MTISKIATSKLGKGKAAVIIEFTDSKFVLITEASLATHNTEAKLKSEAEKQSGKTLTDISFHLNRDGSVAIAIGAAPTLWPEDWPPAWHV